MYDLPKFEFRVYSGHGKYLGTVFAEDSSEATKAALAQFGEQMFGLGYIEEFSPNSARLRLAYLAFICTAVVTCAAFLAYFIRS